MKGTLSLPCVGGPEAPLSGLPPVEVFDDFIGTKVDGSADSDDWDWYLDSGTGASVAGRNDAPGGQLALLTGNDGVGKYTTAHMNGEAFQFAQGKPLYFECRMELSRAATSGFFIGLCREDSSILAGSQDYFAIRMADGRASQVAEFVAGLSGADTVLSSGVTMENNEWHTFAFAWDGYSWITCFADGERIGQIGSGIADTEVMTLSMEVMAQEANGNYMWVDYILCRQAR